MPRRLTRPRAASRAAEGATAPKTPPCIVTIFSAASWLPGSVAPVQSREDQALVAAVVGLAHRRVHADVGRDAGEDDVGDPARSQQEVEVGGVERALAGLVDDQLALDRGDLGHDLPARLARARGSARTGRRRRCRRRCSSNATACSAGSRRGRAVALAGVDDGPARASRARRAPRGRLEARPGERRGRSPSCRRSRPVRRSRSASRWTAARCGRGR